MNITEIVQHAKDDLLKEGEHRPWMYVEFEEKELNLIAFADFPYETTLEKQKALFGLGRKLGTESPGKNICQIIFIVEAWMSSYRSDEKRKYVAPSKDPNRKEVLTVQVLDANLATRTITESVHIVDMLRDGSGELVDLLHRKDEMQEVHSPLLTAFLAGFESTKLSDKEFARIMEQAFRENLHGK